MRRAKDDLIGNRDTFVSFKAIVVRAVRNADVKKCHRSDRTLVSVNAIAGYISDDIDYEVERIDIGDERITNVRLRN